MKNNRVKLRVTDSYNNINPNNSIEQKKQNYQITYFVKLPIIISIPKILIICLQKTANKCASSDIVHRNDV